MTPLAEEFLKRTGTIQESIQHINVLKQNDSELCEACPQRSVVDYNTGYVELCECTLIEILESNKKFMSEYIALKMKGKVDIEDCDDYDDDDYDEDDEEDDDYDDEEDDDYDDDDYVEDYEY
jgi:hypothetical protein